MTTVTENEPRAGVPVPNVELLRATLRRVEAHPEQLDQMQYRGDGCGCFAWHTLMVVYNEAPPWVDPDDTFNDDLVADADDLRENVFHGRTCASDRAQRLLGLTDGQRYRLFYGGNDLRHLRDIVSDLSGGIGGMDPTFTGGAR